LFLQFSQLFGLGGFEKVPEPVRIQGKAGIKIIGQAYVVAIASLVVGSGGIGNITGNAPLAQVFQAGSGELSFNSSFQSLFVSKAGYSCNKVE